MKRLYDLPIATRLTIGYGIISIQNGTARPIRAMTEAMQRRAGEDLSATIPAHGRADEVDRMTTAMVVFRDNPARAEQLRAAQDLTSVAAAVEQLTASIEEISRQMTLSADVVRAAVKHAESSQHCVRELAESTGRIGDVVELINSITGQTNVLALNATIEAARAGEAGRGFAVVAGEVKALASQTMRAMEQVASVADLAGGIGRDVASGATDVGQQTDTLRHQVDRFLVVVRDDHDDPAAGRDAAD